MKYGIRRGREFTTEGRKEVAMKATMVRELSLKERKGPRRNVKDVKVNTSYTESQKKGTRHDSRCEGRM